MLHDVQKKLLWLGTHKAVVYHAITRGSFHTQRLK